MSLFKNLNYPCSKFFHISRIYIFCDDKHYYLSKSGTFMYENYMTHFNIQNNAPSLLICSCIYLLNLRSNIYFLIGGLLETRLLLPTLFTLKRHAKLDQVIQSDGSANFGLSYNKYYIMIGEDLLKGNWNNALVNSDNIMQI